MKYLVAALLAVSAVALSNRPAGAVAFEEIAAQRKLGFVLENSPTPNKNQPETMPAGVALLDYDLDGRMDVYFTNGAAIPSLRKESAKYHNRLFRQMADGTFADVTGKAGVAGAGYGMGVAVADYDNDGDPDLYLANVGDNQLFRNNGDGTFSDVTRASGAAGGFFNGRKMWSVGAGWFDYDHDGLLDLFVVNYCRWEVNKDPYCSSGGGSRAYCHPRFYEPLPNTLFRNNGDGTFTDVSEKTGIARHFGKGMSVSFADHDDDGFIDAFVANDTTANFLFRNIGGQRFEEAGMKAGVAFDEDGNALSGMGSDFRDIDNDGRPDIWHTAVELESFPYFRNRGNGLFFDATSTAGLTRITSQMSGWSNGVFDFDNDGWKDLFVARSNVLDNIAEGRARQYPEPLSVIRNLHGKGFEEAADPVLGAAAAHRGAAFGDVDGDGRVDAVVSVLRGPAKLLRNTGGTGHHWLIVELRGTRSNRMGLGARIRVTAENGVTQWNTATTAVGYACASDSRVHFGLGTASRVRQIEVRWPSGAVQTLTGIEANRVLRIEEPRG